MSSISLRSGFAKLHASRSFMTYMPLRLRVFTRYVPLCLMHLRGLHSLLKNLIHSSWASYLCVSIFFKFSFLEDYSRYYKPFWFYVGQKAAVKHFNLRTDGESIHPPTPPTCFFSKNISSKERLKPWFFVTFNENFFMKNFSVYISYFHQYLSIF